MVAIFYTFDPTPVLSVSDSLGSNFVQETSFVDGFIFVANLTASGADTINITDSSLTAASIFAEIFEVSGVTTVGAQTALGYNGLDGCTYNGCGISTNSTVAFVPGAFLVARSKKHRKMKKSR